MRRLKLCLKKHKSIPIHHLGLTPAIEATPQKGSKPTHEPPRELKISVREEATEDLSFVQSPKIKSFKEMVAALQIVKKNLKVILNC